MYVCNMCKVCVRYACNVVCMCVVAWYGKVRYGMAWHGTAWHGMVWHGMVRYDMVWYGMVWYGMAWYGLYRKVTCKVTQRSVT